MSALAEAKKTWTVAEYLTQERQEGERYEYRNGNIILIVEVLSKSTECYNQEQKFLEYRLSG